MARIATSLDVLRAEINKACPNRDKSSDGWLGDQAHASRASRHNPNDQGVVCALDVTNDPAHGCDIHAIARALVARADKPQDLEYVISNRMSASRGGGWLWKPYSGVNPHEKHAHFAVGRGPDSEPTPPYDGTSSWHIAEIVAALGHPEEDPDMDEVIKRLDAIDERLRVVDINTSDIHRMVGALAAGDAADAKAIADELATRLKD